MPPPEATASAGGAVDHRGGTAGIPDGSDGGRTISVRLLLAVALLLGAAELGLRSPLARTRLLLPTHYYQDGVPLRALALEDVIREHGRVDVLFVGSSIVRTNIRPLVVDGRFDTEIVSFNAGLSGLLPDAVRFYAQHFWLERAAPRLVVQGIRPRELAWALRAEDQERLVGGRIEALWMSERPADRLHAEAIERVRLLQYQGWLTEALDRRRGGRTIDARGHTPTGLTLEEALEDELIGGADVYTGREDFGVGLAAIRELHALSKARGIGFALLNVPEHPAVYASPESEAMYADYLRALDELARREGFAFIDPTDGRPRAFAGTGVFSDYHHMTPEGARALSEAIAGPIERALASE